jgi:hypothetical protein
MKVVRCIGLCYCSHGLVLSYFFGMKESGQGGVGAADGIVSWWLMSGYCT